MHRTSLDSARRGRGLDARALLLAALVLILGIKGLHRPLELAAAGGALLLVVAALGVPWRAFLSRLLWVLPFCLAALPLLFTVPGPALFRWGWWTATEPGALRVLEVIAQCLLCFGVLLLATSLSGPYELVDALGRLGCPERLVAVLRLCLRYLDLLAEELRRLQRARHSRGCQEPGLLFRARVTGQLAGTLFLRSLARAERVEVAMRSRGGVAAACLVRPATARWGLAETLLIGLSLALAGVSWMT